MALSDIWSELKRKTVAGDLSDKLRNRPYIQSLGFISRRNEPVLTLDLVPAIKTLRTNLIGTRFLPRTTKEVATSMMPKTPTGFFSAAHNEPERSGIRIQSSRAITPLTQGPRLRVKSV